MILSTINLSDSLLTYTVTYGSPLLFVVLLIGAAGIPLPCTFLVLAAGAFVHQGILDMYSALGFALSGVVLGDSAGYWMGRFARQYISLRFKQSNLWKKAQIGLDLHGGIAIYLTRWLFTPLAIPTNLIAGSAGYTYSRFLVFDIAGEITWLLIFGGLGYSFSSRLDGISELVSNLSGLFMGLVLLAAGLFIIHRKKRMRQNA